MNRTCFGLHGAQGHAATNAGHYSTRRALNMQPALLSQASKQAVINYCFHPLRVALVRQHYVSETTFSAGVRAGMNSS